MSAWSWCWTHPETRYVVPHPRVQLWGAASPLKLLPASSSPKSRLEMSRMLIWFSLPLVMLCRAPSQEVPVPAGKEELGQCRRVVLLEMSTKKTEEFLQNAI